MLEEFGAESGHEAFPLSSFDLSDPAARLRTMDFMGVDHQMLYPTTLYARMSRDPGFEAALMRSYNRYVGRQCQSFPKRLKWAGLLPLRDARQGLEAIEEMAKLGATAAVVYGTAGERLLCDPSFAPVWDELHRSGLPLCVHMGMSYPPFLEVCDGLLAAHGIGMTLPAMMAFVAIVGCGMLDRYPNLKVGFFEFGAEWILYMVPRLDHYLPIDRSQMPIKSDLSAKSHRRTGKVRANFYRRRSGRSNAARRNRFAGRGSNSLLLRSAARGRAARRGERNSCPPRHRRIPKAQDSLRQRGQVLRGAVNL